MSMTTSATDRQWCLRRTIQNSWWHPAQCVTTWSGTHRVTRESFSSTCSQLRSDAAALATPADAGSLLSLDAWQLHTHSMCNTVSEPWNSPTALQSHITPQWFTSVRHFLHHHCHHPLLLLSSNPDSKLIFSTNPFLHSSSIFPPTGLAPWTPAVFRFSQACRF